MFKKLVLALLLLTFVTAYSSQAYAIDDEPVYTQLREVDKGTFNEYRYKITDAFFNFRNKYEIEGSIDAVSAKVILELAKKGYNYLPDSLSNKNYYNQLKTAIERGLKYPNNSSNYSDVVVSIENFLDKTNIKTIKGTIEAFPKTGNAPLTATLRGKVVDPTGSAIPSYNYTWWMNENGVRKVLGDNITLKHVFNEEGTFAVFLDVSSSHKNEAGYTDVLPFSSRATITIKEKVASVIIKVNSESLRNKDELKFTPDEARYGLLFDATSSTATDGAEFTQTTWDFGNGVERKYTGDPRVERVIYAKEGEFTVSLKLRTNELKQIERKFIISVHDPIATINASQEEGYMGDKFTFSAQSGGNDKDLSYSWEIIDLNKDEVLLRKSGSLFTYSFDDKGKYNVKMTVTEPSGEVDVDSKIIYINSRSPSADFVNSIPFPNKPNKVFFDATKSFDPDFSDDGKLKYEWIINGDRVELEEPNFNGSTGYFTFESIGDHSVVLDVEDPDGISSQMKAKVPVKSILSVEFFAFPRVAQRLNTIRFVSTSPEAKFYEWDFGDGENKGGKDGNIAHKYEKSGIFNVKLKVRDVNDNVNTFTKNVYIGDSNNPYSFISVQNSARDDIGFDNEACNGKGAYVLNRVDSVIFSGKESINIDGKNTGLTYSWKLGKESYKNSQEFTKKFDELGCFPVKLTVKSDDNGKTHSTTKYVTVRNIKPILSSVDVRVVDDSTDPVIVNVSALGAKDRDGVIQSYLWYYYTDIDSEPQDFRATKSSSTSFVLPKVTGNYYFVVVMKDNNEDRITSEEITGSKYFMTLTGDNLNTPLVKLSVNDSSIAIGDEVIFNANVENILGQDLSKKVKYSWDFDGDGFYDKETTSNSVEYKYTSSGEKHAKVKAKYKGFSNTKSLTISVSNVLKPEFGYISIGNKFVFFDRSIGTADTHEWDLGDGTIIKDKKYFVHTFEDGKVSHVVKYKISEGTKVKEIEQKVTKNVKNMILAKKEGLIILSSPTMTEEKIIIEEEGQNAFIYLGASNPDVVNYVMDYDIEYDSDLNGGNDDDEDNVKLNSYTSGDAIKVELNDNKYQTVRVFVKNTAGEVIDSKDIIIEKKYVSEELIDLNNIIFDGVSDSTKLKIEKLKEQVEALPKEHKLKALMYVQKLQEEWGDNREKTNVILEFEGFIYDIEINNGEEIINLLESLLVENQEDKSEKAITFNALKNLLPVSISCTDDVTNTEKVCYEDMVLKLEAIKDNDNIDENKVLGTEILNVVAVDNAMTNKEKTDFKAILKTFVYGGVDNIPDSEKQEIEDEDNGKTSSDLGELLINILIWIFVIFGGFALIVLLYYIYYLLVNKNNHIGFQDFIIEKTSGAKQVKSESKVDEIDILNDLQEDLKSDEKIELKDEISDSILEGDKQDIETDNKLKDKKEDSESIITETKTKNKNQENKVEDHSEEVPDWLKGSFSEEKSKPVKKEEVKTNEKKSEFKEEKTSIVKEVKTENKTQDDKSNKESSEDIPDWLKGSFSEDKEETKEEKIEEVKVSKKEEISKAKEVKKEEKKEKIEKKEIISDKKIEKETKIEDENIPDWLKGSFSEDVNKKEVEAEAVMEKSKESKNNNSDDNIPDWLKGSFEEPKAELKKTILKKIDTKKDEAKTTNTKLNQTKKAEPKKEEVKKVEEVKIVEESKKTDVTKENKQTTRDKQPVNKKETLVKKTETSKTPEKKAPVKKIEKTLEKTLEKKPEVKTKQTPKATKQPTKSTTDKKQVEKKQTKKQDTKKEDNKETNTELWDDGMKVPDWLKTDDEK